MKKIFLVFSIIPTLVFAQPGNQTPRVALNNMTDSFSYAVGVSISNSLIEQGVTELNIGALSQAFVDVLTNKDKQLTLEKATAVIQQRMQEFSQKKAQVEEDASAPMGKVIPDFEQADASGKMVNIKSFRGKYVLIDFWASWCGPCRGENPNVVAAYNKYKNKNFTVLGISLDKDKNAWLAAVQKDGLTWTQLSDLKFWSNAVAQQFRIQSIPQNFLIDPNGVVIGKNLRGEALEAKLESVIK